MMGYLSTDKRDLSTKSLSEQQLEACPITQMCQPLNQCPQVSKFHSGYNTTPAGRFLA